MSDEGPTVESRRRWREEFPRDRGNGPIVNTLLDALDEADTRLADVNRASLSACLALGRQLAAIELVAETWSARAMEAEEELAKLREPEPSDPRSGERYVEARAADLCALHRALRLAQEAHRTLHNSWL